MVFKKISLKCNQCVTDMWLIWDPYRSIQPTPWFIWDLYVTMFDPHVTHLWPICNTSRTHMWFIFDLSVTYCVTFVQPIFDSWNSSLTNLWPIPWFINDTSAISYLTSLFDVWRGVWRCAHGKLAPQTRHPLARDCHIGPASWQGGTLWGMQPFCPHFSSAI